MTDWIYIFDYSLSGALLVMMLLGITFSAFMPTLDRWNKRYFITLFSLLFVCTVTCFLALIFWENPTMAEAAKIVYLFEGLVILGIYVLILIIAQFTTAFYYVTPDNKFFRGSLWWLWLVQLVLIMILNIARVIRNQKKLSKKYFIALLVYLLPMTAVIIIHMFIPVETYVIFGMALLAMMMFVLILSDNMEQYTRQQQEIFHQRADIMVLQMRPHFIYNTMMGIYYLCKQDADKAQQVTLDFTTYLRRNFTAIASENTVPFKDELEHTHAYLAVEQAQFEDRLFVSFDTPHAMFQVPPLTLQPLVENAVKHGMNPDGNPLNISVKTRQTKGGSEIIVEDDGSGFNSAGDQEPHIALNNIRQRLEMMCKGKMVISPREGGGTVVKITIPASSG